MVSLWRAMATAVWLLACGPPVNDILGNIVLMFAGKPEVVRDWMRTKSPRAASDHALVKAIRLKGIVHLHHLALSPDREIKSL
jgi:hypothetical protein